MQMPLLLLVVAERFMLFCCFVNADAAIDADAAVDADPADELVILLFC